MRLKISKSKNAQSLYVIASTYENGKHSSRIVEKLGTYDQLSKLHDDPIAWAKSYIEELNRLEKEQKREVVVKYKQSKRIPMGEQRRFNIGYLFLQQIYYSLGLPQICTVISDQYKFTFDLNGILSRLIYGRVLFPSSKLKTFEESKKFLEQPTFSLHHVYRALDVIAAEDAFIQSELYKNSKALSKRNDKVLFYDCTNFFFEIEQEEGLKQYGPSKQHQPLPLVEMGLFMDGDGIPLAFSIHPGNSNEQQTLIPLEEQILRDFRLAKFVVCTDSGLSSKTNRQFNTKGGRAFITTQSIKKLKQDLKDWCLNPTGWKLEGMETEKDGLPKTFDIHQLQTDEKLAEHFKQAVFYKERWIKENGLEQKLIVTFSLKYKYYQQNIRNRQIERARKLLDGTLSSLKQHSQNDCKRFIKRTGVTSDGEIADHDLLEIDCRVIEEESRYDGFYAVCTNLEDPAPQIAKISQRRWEIEECFRIMKTDFKSRPAYVRTENRIKAHFLTCFLSLILYRYLEKALDDPFTADEILDTLRDMEMFSVHGEGYVPTYTRTDVTDALHETFGFRTDYEIINQKEMKKIFQNTKRGEKVLKKSNIEKCQNP